MLSLTLPGTDKARIFTLDKPDRLVVDLPTLPAGTKPAMPPNYSGKLLKALRSGQFDPRTTRIVFELNDAPAGVQSKVDGRTLRITLAPPVPGAPKAAPVKPLKPEAKKKEDERPVIVIDAGHGGQDPGTQGVHGTVEKEIVLAYARGLRNALAATGRYRVHLTREDDRFILLRGRTEIARKAGADMFLSIHADSAPDGARGLSVYTLSEKSSDAEAEALAARENKVDAVYGLDLSDQSKDVADILISLAQRDTNNRSATLAGNLLDAMRLSDVRLLPNPHRFAGFAVLKAPDIPSVLVEIGFLTNAQEEMLLSGKAYREKVIKGLVKGIDAYFIAKNNEGAKP